jgi:hypothetical protein
MECEELLTSTYLAISGMYFHVLQGVVGQRLAQLR